MANEVLTGNQHTHLLSEQDEYREASRRQKFAASEEKELREEVSAQEMTERMIKYTGLKRGSADGQRQQKRQRQRK